MKRTICVFAITLFAVQATVLDNINTAIVANFIEDIDKSNTTAREYFKTLFQKIARDDVEIGNDVIGDCSVSEKTQHLCKKALKENCLNFENLLFNQLNDQDHPILSWFPSLVYHAYGHACLTRKPDKKAKDVTNHITVPSAKVWGYGIGFVAIICAVSNIGGLMAPFMKHRFFQRLLLFCVALAVGTLGATGMLVLIPESLGLTSSNSPIPNYHQRMATVMGGIYFFYVSERLLKFWFYRKKEPVTIEKVSPDELCKAVNMEHENLKECEFMDEENEMQALGELQKSKPKNKITTVALMILAGDALHNFVDGIAIGAAFTENTYLGMSVSISVICEELPHELGDIAILLHTGLGMKRSLCYNFLAALTIVLGLMLGIIIGENTNANMWIFAVAGGMFVYISLVDMLPEMAEQARHVEETGIESKWTAFIIQNMGLVTGFVIILMLVMFGGNIAV